MKTLKQKQEELKNLMKMMKENPEAYIYSIVYYKTLGTKIYFEGKAKDFSIKKFIKNRDLEALEVSYILSKNLIEY